jgi:hypothetical protein
MVSEFDFPNKAHALRYASRGFPVFPCHRNKSPMTAHGFKDATTDARQILTWWDASPEASIGVPTAGYLVLDVDARKGGDQTLAEYEAKHGPMPVTPTAKTGSGGRHYWFAKPEGKAFKSKASIAPGLDVRTDGGYVIVPPSVNEVGPYAWLVALDAPMALPPAWFVELAEDRPAQATPKPTPGPAAPFTFTWGKDEVNDLASHQGAAEGERNATLCRLAGVHLSRGDSPATLEALALAWAKRCKPAYPEAEVKRTLAQLTAKSQGKGEYVPKAEATAEGEDAPPLPTPPTLGAEAYTGVFGEYVRLIEPHTEADSAAVLLSCLVLFGNAVGRRPYFPVEADEHHCNLFLACIGQSSHARKGVSFGRALALFPPEYAQRNIITGLSSGEGVISAIRDPIFKMKEGVIDVLDEGVTDKRLLVVEQELAQTLKVLRREGNTLSPVLRCAFDGSNLRASTKCPQIATAPHVSIIGHITRQELCRCLTEQEFFNGFSNRFLWAFVRRSKFLPDGGMGVDLSPFRQAVADALVKASRVTLMQRSAEATALWRELYSELESERPGLWGAVTGRGAALTLRLSMVYALADGSAVIERRHLQSAYAVWRFCCSSARYLFGDDEPLTPLEGKVLALVTDRPGVSRKEIYDGLGRNTAMPSVGNALASLRDKQRVHARLDNQTGGRPAERWYPGPAEPTPTPLRPNAESQGDTLSALGRSSASEPPTPEPPIVQPMPPPTLTEAQFLAELEAL